MSQPPAPWNRWSATPSPSQSPGIWTGCPEAKSHGQAEGERKAPAVASQARWQVAGSSSSMASFRVSAGGELDHGRRFFVLARGHLLPGGTVRFGACSLPESPPPWQKLDKDRNRPPAHPCQFGLRARRVHPTRRRPARPWPARSLTFVARELLCPDVAHRRSHQDRAAVAVGVAQKPNQAPAQVTTG